MLWWVAIHRFVGQTSSPRTTNPDRVMMSFEVQEEMAGLSRQLTRQATELGWDANPVAGTPDS